MLLEYYILLEIVVFALFILAFFVGHELIWSIELVLSAVISFASFNVQQLIPVFNATINAYEYVAVSAAYPVMVGINSLLFFLSLILFFYDIFEKYGVKFLPASR